MDDSHIEVQEIDLQTGLDETLLEAFGRHELKNPQFGLDWLLNLSEHALAHGETAVILKAHTAAGDFVALPLKRDRSRGEAAALGNFYTSAYSPLICADEPLPLLTALFQYLASRTRTGIFTLSPLAISAELFEQIENALQQAGWRGIHRFFCFGNWTHDLADPNYSSYFQQRPSQLRNTITRRTRQFHAQDKGRVHMVTGGDQLDSAIDQFTEIYSSSWKQEEPFPYFMPGLLRLAARKGWLRLGIAVYDNVAIAAQAWLVSGDCAYIYKLAHREDARHLSPGTVLTAFMMEQAINRDGVKRIDFLSGDDSYKADWMSARDARYGIAAYNYKTVRGAFMGASYALKNLARLLLPNKS